MLVKKVMRKYFRSFSNMLWQVVEEADPGMGRAGTVVDQVYGMQMLSQIENETTIQRTTLNSI